MCKKLIYVTLLFLLGLVATPAGVVCAEDFVTVNQNGPDGWYMFRQTDGEVDWSTTEGVSGLSLMRVGPDGNVYSATSNVKQLKVWDGQTGDYLGVSFQISNRLYDICFGPDIDGDGIEDLYTFEGAGAVVNSYTSSSGYTEQGSFTASVEGGAWVGDFGPDITGDGVQELYVLPDLAQNTSNVLKVIDGATKAEHLSVPIPEVVRPGTLVAASDGRIYITGRNNDRVVSYLPDGTDPQIVVEGGEASNFSTQIAEGKPGEWYISNRFNVTGLPGDAGSVVISTDNFATTSIEIAGTTAADLYQCIAAFYIPGKEGLAKAPDPKNQATDVLRDTVLTWGPGKFPAGHKVYFGDTFEDVNSATEASEAYKGEKPLEDTSFDPGRMGLGETYFWRIDEVNNTNPNSPWKGDVWSFTVEPFGYPIEDIIATASSSNTADEGPENTVNSSGLNDNLHSTVLTDMWFTAAGEPTPAWIQYDFDKAYKLHEMLVWNYNGPSFLTAVGLKDVVVEYSSDGTDLVQIDSVNEFAKASGLDDYPPNTTVPLDGILAKSVKISASSNWSGGFSDQFGLSEVQILQIPVNAREPFPVSGATDVDVDVILGWRAGREAASHDVYISDDPNALTLADSVDEPVFDTASQGLALGQSYHWRIDEVNDAETPKTWQGELWNFTTQEYIVVDDFESYNTTDRQIWEIWLDGLGFGTAGTPNYNPGNGTGSAIGDENSPSYMEETIVHSGSKSMPVAYNNSAATTSEVIVQTSDLPIGGDWTKGAAETLVLWFYGDPANAASERMYVKVNGEKVDYPGDAMDITRPIWQQWNIDLTALGISLSNVPQMTIGFERTSAFGGSGKVLIDDIRLYRLAPLMASENIWLEAEAATTQGASWRMYDDPSASGGQYMGSEDGDGDDNSNPPGAEWLATYNFTVSGGVYKLVARIITAPGNSFWVRISDATSPQITRDDGWVNTNPMDEEDTWHWDEIHNDQQNDNVVNFTLSAGQHTLEIAKREDGARLDAVLITDQLE